MSRGDGSQVVFGDAVVESGLDGGPGVLDGCWWVVRVTEQVFDELLCVVAKSSSGLEDEWDQVDAGGTCRTVSSLHVQPCSLGGSWLRI